MERHYSPAHNGGVTPVTSLAPLYNLFVPHFAATLRHLRHPRHAAAGVRLQGIRLTVKMRLIVTEVKKVVNFSPLTTTFHMMIHQKVSLESACCIRISSKTAGTMPIGLNKGQDTSALIMRGSCGSN